jgi:hypothetical protein
MASVRLLPPDSTREKWGTPTRRRSRCSASQPARTASCSCASSRQRRSYKKCPSSSSPTRLASPTSPPPRRATRCATPRARATARRRSARAGARRVRRLGSRGPWPREALRVCSQCTAPTNAPTRRRQPSRRSPCGGCVARSAGCALGCARARRTAPRAAQAPPRFRHWGWPLVLRFAARTTLTPALTPVPLASRARARSLCFAFVRARPPRSLPRPRSGRSDVPLPQRRGAFTGRPAADAGRLGRAHVENRPPPRAQDGAAHTGATAAAAAATRTRAGDGARADRARRRSVAGRDRGRTLANLRTRRQCWAASFQKEI